MKKASTLMLLAGASLALGACASDSGSSMRSQSSAAASVTPSAEGALSSARRTGTAPYGIASQGGSAGSSGVSSATGAAAPGAMASNYRTGTTGPAEAYRSSTASRNADASAAQSASRADYDAGDGTGREATKALNMLMSKGYGAFSDFQRHGDDFTADVAHRGQRVAVLIDPDNGTITSLSGALQGSGSSMPRAASSSRTPENPEGGAHPTVGPAANRFPPQSIR